jgi:hypothetical protein
LELKYRETLQNIKKRLHGRNNLKAGGGKRKKHCLPKTGRRLDDYQNLKQYQKDNKLGCM